MTASNTPSESNGHVAPVTVDAESAVRYLARQPILDAKGNIFGYELLYRSHRESQSFAADGNSATRAMLDNALLFGIDKLTGGLPAFINCTQESLTEELVSVLNPEFAVLEILETIEPTPSLLTALRSLKQSGYRIALDDFVWTPAMEGLVAIADYIKVDVRAHPFGELRDILKRLARYPPRIIAEKVETQEEFEALRKAGVPYFQGYYFCRPVVIEQRRIPANRILNLEMLEQLQAKPLNFHVVSNLLKRDVALTYRLLQLINSPLYGVRQEVRSVHAALVMVGEEMFRRIALLAIASEIGITQSSALLRMAFQRARFCEIAAPSFGLDPAEQYLLGLLSLLPALLLAPMETLTEALPLREPIRQALLGESNADRKPLEWLLACECGDWKLCDGIGADSAFDLSALPTLYTESLRWADAAFMLARA